MSRANPESRAPRCRLHHLHHFRHDARAQIRAAITRRRSRATRPTWRALSASIPEDAKTLLTVPLCGVFGLCNATAALAAGRPLVMLPTFEAQAAATSHPRASHHALRGGRRHRRAIARVERGRSAVSRRTHGDRRAQRAGRTRAGARLASRRRFYGMSEVQGMLSLRGLDEPPEMRELGGGTLVRPREDACVRAIRPRRGPRAPRHERRELRGVPRRPSVSGGILHGMRTEPGGHRGRFHRRRLSEKQATSDTRRTTPRLSCRAWATCCAWRVFSSIRSKSKRCSIPIPP